jgi:hypothetical protein
MDEVLSRAPAAQADGSPGSNFSLSPEDARPKKKLSKAAPPTQVRERQEQERYVFIFLGCFLLSRPSIFSTHLYLCFSCRPLGFPAHVFDEAEARKLELKKAEELYVSELDEAKRAANKAAEDVVAMEMQLESAKKVRRTVCTTCLLYHP